MRRDAWFGNIVAGRGNARFCKNSFERVTKMPVFNAGRVEDCFADAQPLGLADELFQIDVHDDTGAGRFVERINMSVFLIKVEHF